MVALQSESLSCVILQKITFWLVYLGVARAQWTVLSGCNGWVEGGVATRGPQSLEKGWCSSRLRRGYGHFAGKVRKSQQCPLGAISVIRWGKTGRESETEGQHGNTVWRITTKQGEGIRGRRVSVGFSSPWCETASWAETGSPVELLTVY